MPIMTMAGGGSFASPAALTATAALTAGSAQRLPSPAVLTATAALTAGSAQRSSTTAVLAATGTLAAAGSVADPGVSGALLAATGTLAAAGAVTVRSGAALTAVAVLAAAGPTVPSGIGSLPAVVVEIAFTTAPGATPTWTDVSAYVRGGSIHRGRQNELARYEAGTCTLRLDNRTRRFDPTYTSSPYYPNVRPMKKIRVSAAWSTTTYPLFVGFIESWPQDWPGHRDGVVEVTAVDGFKALGLAKLSGLVAEISGAADNGAGLIRLTAKGHGALTGALLVVAGVAGTTEANGSWTVSRIDDDTLDLQGSAFVHAYAGNGTASTYPAQLSSARVTQILDAIGWLAADRTIETGVSTLQPTAYDKADALSMLQEIELSENGRLFVGKDGLLRFDNRHSPYLSTSAFTFDGTHYQEPVVEYDDSQIWNSIVVTRDGGAAQTQADATSKTAYLTRTMDRSEMTCTTDNECNDAAAFLLSIYKDPAIRLSSVQFRAARLPATLWPALLARELGERITVTVQPPAGGALISQQSFIEGIEMDFSAAPTDWAITLRLSAVGISYQIYAAGKAFFTLGNATNGILSSGTGVLTY